MDQIRLISWAVSGCQELLTVASAMLWIINPRLASRLRMIRRALVFMEITADPQVIKELLGVMSLESNPLVHRVSVAQTARQARKGEGK